MKTRVLQLAGLLSVLSLILLVSACHKKSAAVTPPATAPAAQPTATLSAIPATVQKGESVQLKWSTENATNVTIDAVGKVGTEGSQSVTPTDSTTYLLTATGPGGSAQATASVTVKVASASTASKPAGTMLAKGVKDVYFDYDRYDLRSSDAATMQADADYLSAHAGDKVTIAGHCDERGSVEYNLALGISRANAVSAKLESLGIASDRLKTVSYGKEKPFCTEHDEACWQQNRRAHFTLSE